MRHDDEIAQQEIGMEGCVLIERGSNRIASIHLMILVCLELAVSMMLAEDGCISGR